MLALVAVVALVPSLAEAQRTTRRRQTPIEIRGQVPTPQVVTVRPREVPAYSRQVLVPNFYDHDFWQSILPGYHLIPERVITGAVPGDSASRAAGAATGTPPVTSPAAPPVAVPADTTRATPGTTPARTPR
jgi:hypothetical protein